MNHLSVLPPKDPEDSKQDLMKAPTHNELTHLQYVNLLFGALKLTGSSKNPSLTQYKLN
jgi:hypothetical protein